MALPTLVTSDTDNKNKKAIESIISLKIIAKNFMILNYKEMIFYYFV